MLYIQVRIISRYTSNMSPPTDEIQSKKTTESESQTHSHRVAGIGWLAVELTEIV